MMVWRSVRAGGDTKTKKSRRTLALPERCVDALREQRERQRVARELAGERWVPNDLVFASEVGTELDSANVRRGFRRVAADAGLNAAAWTPREMRHSCRCSLTRACRSSRSHVSSDTPEDRRSTASSSGPPSTTAPP